MGSQQEGSHWQARIKLSPKSDHADTLTLDFHPPEE